MELSEQQGKLASLVREISESLAEGDDEEEPMGEGKKQ